MGANDYTIEQVYNNGIGDLIIKDGQENELIRYSLSSIFNNFIDREPRYGEISMDEAEFVTENDKAIIKIVVLSLNYELWENSEYENINAYIMVKIK